MSRPNIKTEDENINMENYNKAPNQNYSRKDVITIDGIDCYEKNGIVYLNLEAVARGLGFTYLAHSGNEVVRWNTVREYIGKFGVATSCDGNLPPFIPENIFYRLAMKANNKAAENFQERIANEIIPTIRRHGAYMTPETIEKTLMNPDFIIQLASKLKEEQESNINLRLTNAALVEETNEWDIGKLILKLMRLYATKEYDGDFQLAFCELYGDMNYKMGINLKSRRTKQGDPKKKYIDLLTPAELKYALKIVVSMCENAEIDTGEIIRKHASPEIISYLKWEQLREKTVSTISKK